VKDQHNRRFAAVNTRVLIDLPHSLPMLTTKFLALLAALFISFVTAGPAVLYHLIQVVRTCDL
jgi:hypothetical protein